MLLGAAWWLLAPAGRVLARPGYLLAVDDPELLAGQDVTFAALGLAAGAAVGVWTAVRPRRRPVQRVACALLGSGLGSVLCWQVGRFLGPDPVGTVQASAGSAVPAPLDVHALGVLAVWPAATALFGFLAFLTVSWRHPE